MVQIKQKRGTGVKNLSLRSFWCGECHSHEVSCEWQVLIHAYGPHESGHSHELYVRDTHRTRSTHMKFVWVTWLMRATLTNENLMHMSERYHVTLYRFIYIFIYVTHSYECLTSVRDIRSRRCWRGLLGPHESASSHSCTEVTHEGHMTSCEWHEPRAWVSSCEWPNSYMCPHSCVFHILRANCT